MATKRYVLYVSNEDQKAILAPWIKSQTHIQPMSQLQTIPSWLQPLQKPVLVDMLKLEAVWGTEIGVLMESRKPPSKFGPVDPID